TEMSEQGVGPQLAIRPLAEIEFRGPRMSLAVVGRAPEFGWNLDRHGHSSFLSPGRTMRHPGRARTDSCDVKKSTHSIFSHPSFAPWPGPYPCSTSTQVGCS